MSQKTIIHGILQRSEETWLLKTDIGSIAIGSVASIEPALEHQDVSILGALYEPSSVRMFFADRIVTHAEIAARAMAIYNSGTGGSSEENWIRAEKELLGLPLTSANEAEATGLWRVHGHITFSNGTHAGRLLVRAFDRDVSKEELLGETVTEDSGHYAINYIESQFRSTSSERGGPEVYIRIFDASGQLLSHSKTHNNAPREIELNLTLPADVVIRFVVRGRVTSSDGKPVAMLQAKAFDRNVGTDDTLLGEATTDAQGNYSIAYSPDQLNGKLTADLLVAIYREGRGAPVQTSDVIFDAGSQTVKDFFIAAPVAPEFDRLTEQIRLLLSGQPLGKLDPKQIAFLNRKTKIEAEKIERLAQSHDLADGNKLLADFYYALLAAGLPTVPETILARDRATIDGAIERATAANLIAPLGTDQLDRILDDELPKLRALKLLEPAGAGQPASLGDLLDTLPKEDKLDENARLAFAIRYGSHGQTVPLWEAQETSAYAGSIPALKRTLALSEITQAHKPLVAALQKQREAGKPESVAYLAKLSPVDWLELTLTHGSPPNSQTAATDYAVELDRAVEQRFATDVLRERLASGALSINGFPTEKVVKVLSAHQDFDLRKERADDFLGRVGATTPELSAALRKIQRVLPLAGDLQGSAALLNAGFDSAFAIARTGVSVLAGSVAGELSEAQAKAIHAAARDSTATAMALVARCSPQFNPHAIEAIPYSAPNAAFLAKYPDLRALFGDLDYCACQHCESVLSPAAYLADLLHFLETSGQPLSNHFRKSLSFWALHARRRDISNLLLNCDNTNIEIPYIDLVLEILENQIALPACFKVTAQHSEEISAALARNELPDPIRDALAKTAVTIGAKPYVTRIDSKEECIDALLKFESAQIPGAPEYFYPILNEAAGCLKIADGAREWIVLFTPKGLWMQISAKQAPELGALGDAMVDEFESSLARGEMPAAFLEDLTEGWVPCSSQVKVLGSPTQSESKPRFTAYEVSISLSLDVVGRHVGQVLQVRYIRPEDDTVVRRTKIPKQHQKVVTAWLEGKLPHRFDRQVLDLLGIPVRPWTITHLKPGRCALRYALQKFTFGISDAVLGVLALTYRSSSIQTDLAAIPENRNPAAYDVLRKAVYPWALPFDLSTEEIRTYLKELGISRQKLMEIAGMALGEGLDGYAREVLGLTVADKEPLAVDPWTVWDLKEKNNSVEDSVGQSHIGSWTEVLQNISILLDRAGLTFRELLDIRQTGCGIVSWSNITPKGECRPTKMTWEDLGQEQLTWIHAFTCLWRKCGWSMRELNCGLAAVVQNPRDVLTSPQMLSLVGRLHSKLNRPILHIAAMLGHVEIRPWVDHTKEGVPIYASLYDTVFQGSALRGSESFALFAINVESCELAYLDPTPTTPKPKEKPLSDHSHFLAASLGITPDQIKQLVVGLNVPDELTFSSLVKLLGAAAFSRGLGLAVEDFIRWTAFLGNPFDAKGTEGRAKALLAFADNVEFARETNASLDELDYILRHELTGEFAYVETRMIEALSGIRDALRKGPVLGDVSTENLLSQLRKLGASESLLTAISKQAGMESVLKAEVLIAVTSQPLPELPPGSVGKFYFRKSDSDSKVWLGCRGVVWESDFRLLRNAFPTDIDTLEKRYGFIREVLASQLLYLVDRDAESEIPAVPYLEIPLASDSVQSLPEDLLSVFVLQEKDGGRALRLAGILTDKQSLETLLPELKSTEINALNNQSEDIIKTGIQFLAADTAERLLVQTDAAIGDVLLKLVPILEVDLLVSQVSALLSLETQTARRLLDTIKLPSAPGRTARDLLTDPVLLAPDSSQKIDANLFLAQVQVLVRLDKAARVLRKASLTASQLDWVDGNSFAVLSFNDLPVRAASTGLFSNWRAFGELLRFRDAVEGGSETVQAISDLLLKTAVPSVDDNWFVKQAASFFKNAYGLEQAAIEKNCEFLGIQTRDQFRNPQTLLRLIGLLHVLKLLGTTVPVIEGLLSDAPECADAMAARKLFMAQFDPEDLPKRLQPISDKLRIRQRDALVSYLKWRDQLPDDNALLDYYLIDVKMEPCMRTSRVKQAISSVQLFIQRCMLNLEKDAPMKVLPGDIDATQWHWMKNYRVWEANRKVFLYPENWIEPDLRDDKSEIFRAFESELLQEGLTHERAVGAFHSYIDGLAAVACPVIISTWHENNASGRRRIHIAARDRGTPHKVYYRCATMAPGSAPRWSVEWTPWERIDREFPNGHIMVCEMDGIVYLLCPAINRDERSGWKIHMETLRRTKAGWVALKGSVDYFTHVLVPNKSLAQSFVFRPVRLSRSFGETVQVQCFRAIVQENERIQLRNEGRLTVDSPPPFNPNDPQFATVRIRIVDHFKDPAHENIDTYQLSDIGFTLSAKFDIKWFYRDLIGDEKELSLENDGAFTFNDGVRRVPTNTSTVMSEPPDFTEEMSLSGLMDNSVNAAIQTLSEQERRLLKTLADTLAVQLALDLSWLTPEQATLVAFSGGAALPGFISVEVIKRLATMKFPIYFKVVRILGIDVNAKVPAADVRKFSNTTFTQHIELGEYNNSGTIELDMVLHYKDGEVPERAAADRQLKFERAGAFEFDESRSLIYLKPNQTLFNELDNDSPLDGCEYFDSGYLRRPEPEPSGIPLRLRSTSQPILSDSHNGFFVVNANGPDAGSDLMRPIGAYSDSRFVLFFIASADKYLVLPNGGTWVWAGLRELANETWDAAELERMPALVSGPAAAAIPFNANCPLIDFSASPSTVDLTFDRSLPASNYDWEAMFHAPLLIAEQLGVAQRFEDAQRWFHTIFDPTTDRVGPEAVRYWRFPRFREKEQQSNSIDILLLELANGSSELVGQIDAWKQAPFNPHLIARSRSRAYQWTVVLKYIGNLISWADQSYRRETIESINEATQLYVLAARILGPRPASIPRCKATAMSYLELAYLQTKGLDDFSNALVALEDFGAASLGNPSYGPIDRDVPTGLYFCIPPNSDIEELWQKVDERLFNIRHCRNIEGIERQLPLFEPPIDPALLVKATAAGLDISTILADLSAPLPLYRFSVMLQKAVEVCAELKALGAALLASLEKNDAEELSLLRSSHEVELLRLSAQVRKQQIDEAKLNLDGLKEARKTAEVRYQHYQKLLGKNEITLPQAGNPVSLETVPLSLAKSGLDSDETGLGISQTEKNHLTQMQAAGDLSFAAGILNAAAGVAFAVGVAPMTAPTASAIGQGINAAASAVNAISTYTNSIANRNAIVAGYQRRRDDWIFQSNMALRELQQVDKQIAVAEIRIVIAQQELDNLTTQTKNAIEVDDFMCSKFTNRELYRWMGAQLSSLYFNTYRLAHELAKRAERCFQFELGDEDSSYIEFGYWDSLRKGLLAGENLHRDLKRLDIAYLDRNKREYEITKHVSLLQLNPEALVALRETRVCEFTIPEWLFDMECPGHFLRRLKLVSLSVPCVAGPYTGVHCTLTLLSSVVRKSNSHENYGEPSPEDAGRFRYDYNRIQSVVTSSGQSDSGMFEPNLRDERYLPFEGAGAISTWRLELPAALPQFDYATISDVLLHIRYTAREGGHSLRSAAAAHVSSPNGSGLSRLFSLRQEFPTAWAAFKAAHPIVKKTTAELQIDLKPEHYPYWARGIVEQATGEADDFADVLLYAKPSGVDEIQLFESAVPNVDAEGKGPPPLRRDPMLPGFLSCRLKIKRPLTGNHSLFLASNSIDELWMIVSPPSQTEAD